jgi:hypothetical protein
MEGAAAAPLPGGVEDKGLKRNAIGFVSSVVIGVASTAPGYSLAASLGFIAAVGGIGLQSSAILLLAFIPMAMIAAVYYGLTGYACVVFYRRELFHSQKTFVSVGLLPLLGALILIAVFIKSCVDLSDPENSASGDSWFGIGPPLIIGLGFLIFGAVLMVIW